MQLLQGQHLSGAAMVERLQQGARALLQSLDHRGTGEVLALQELHRELPGH